MKRPLEQIHSPEDIRKMTPAELEELCASLRKTLVQTVSRQADISPPTSGWWS